MGFKVTKKRIKLSVTAPLFASGFKLVIQAEQDLRMMKVKQKISGGFRSFQGTQIFCSLRGLISIHRKQALNVFDSIHSLFPA